MFGYSLFLLKSGVAMAIFRISHHFQLVLMFTIFYNKKIFSLKSNTCQQEKNQVPSNKQRKHCCLGGRKKKTVPCFVSVIFFLFKDKAYIYMYRVLLLPNKKIMKSRHFTFFSGGK